MKKIIATSAAAAGLSVTLTSAAYAQGMNCAPREIVVERLSGTYGEVFSGGGLQNADAVFEVWTSEDAGTWTILMTRPDGLSCIMAAGTDWRKALAGQNLTGAPA